jgi:hypothetical protein
MVYPYTTAQRAASMPPPHGSKLKRDRDIVVRKDIQMYKMIRSPI